MNALEAPSTTEWRQVLRADPCAYCDQASEHVDHIHPLHANGPNDNTNLTGACQRCNQRKAGHSLLAFLSGQPVGHNAHSVHRPAHQASQTRPATIRITPDPRTERQRELEFYADIGREALFREAYHAKHGKPRTNTTLREYAQNTRCKQQSNT